MGIFKISRSGNFSYLILGISVLAIIFSIGLFTYSVNPERFRLSDRFQISAENIINNCNEEFNWRDCYGEQLGRLSGRMGLPETLKVLNEIMVRDARANDCHIISHEIAAAEIKKDPDNSLAMLKFVDQDMCMGGYIHGAIEGKKLFDNSMKIDETTIPEICNSIQEATGNKNIDPCAHVMGHILLVESGADLKKASAICDKLPSAAMQAYCNNGMFMENITRTNLATHGFNEQFFVTDANANLVEEKCEEFEGIARTSCWRELAHMYVDLAYNDLGAVWSFCSRASTENDRDECYIHSFNSVLPLANFDSNQLTKICSRMGDDPKRLSRCYSWAISTLILSSKNLAGRAIEVCEASNNFKENCYKVLGEKLARVSTLSERQLVCSEVEDEYKNSCQCSECLKK